MSRLIVIAASFVSLTALASSAHAQSALSSCDSVTGLSANGQPCVELTPIDPRNIADAPVGAEGAEQYSRLDPSTLGQTYECREADRRDNRYGPNGALLIEDCGVPAQLSDVKPFYGTTGAPAPTPIPASATTSIPAAAPAPAATLPIQPAATTVATVPAAPAAGTFSGISGAAIAGVVAVGGLAAIIAAASSGGSSTPSTN